MKAIRRDELLDLAAYERIRDQFLGSVLARKKPRYLKLGTNMTALFENRDSVLLQIQEMLRTERITQEEAILHELETYNELVPGDRELSVTVFVEYQDRDERERMLSTLAGLEAKFQLRVDGEVLPATPDPRATDPERTMAVHYIKLPLSEKAFSALQAPSVAAALEVTHAAYAASAAFPAALLGSLRDDWA